MGTERTAKIEKFTNGFNQVRYRLVAWWPARSSYSNRYAKTWATRQGARDCAKREGLTVIA